MIPADVKKAVEEEFEMALQDRVMEESNDRNKLSDKYQEFVTDSEREGFTAKLQDETLGVYIAKLEE
nr:heat shock 70 kda protein 14 [Quercus suber]